MRYLIFVLFYLSSISFCYTQENTVKEVDSTELHSSPDLNQGVLLPCVKEGAKVRVKVISDGYDKSLNCQFPKNLRSIGKQFLVDKIELSSSGTFYKVVGDIYSF